jgi:transposase-like protein
VEPLIAINNLIDDAKCYQVVRMLRWPDGKVICPLCESTQIDKHGHHNTEPERQRYFCNSCTTYFEALLMNAENIRRIVVLYKNG